VAECEIVENISMVHHSWGTKLLVLCLHKCGMVQMIRRPKVFSSSLLGARRKEEDGRARGRGYSDEMRKGSSGVKLGVNQKVEELN